MYKSHFVRFSFAPANPMKNANFEIDNGFCGCIDIVIIIPLTNYSFYLNFLKVCKPNYMLAVQLMYMIWGFSSEYASIYHKSWLIVLRDTLRLLSIDEKLLSSKTNMTILAIVRSYKMNGWESRNTAKREPKLGASSSITINKCLDNWVMFFKWLVQHLRKQSDQ